MIKNFFSSLSNKFNGSKNESLKPFSVKSTKVDKTIRIIIVSDTHNRFSELTIPDGDILIHCGDIVDIYRETTEMETFIREFNQMKHKTKILVPGNHDMNFTVQQSVENRKIYIYDDAELVSVIDRVFEKEEKKMIYLNGNSVNTEGLNIFGVHGLDIPSYTKIGDLCKDTIDILITHSPPYNKLDLSNNGELIGNKSLLSDVKKIEPLIHAFGHVHEQYGTIRFEDMNTLFVNASSNEFPGNGLNKPIIIDVVPMPMIN